MALTKKQINTLKELSKYANFESANFDGIADDYKVRRNGNTTWITYNGVEYTITGYIREVTRLYRHSWVQPLIDEMLEGADA